MSNPRAQQLLGLAGGMFVVAAGLTGAYYVVATRSEARAATVPEAPNTVSGETKSVAAAKDITGQPVEVKIAGQTMKLTWGELGIVIDKGELQLDRDKAVKELLQLKAKYDRSPIDAYLDLEEKKIHDDAPGQGIDVFGTLPKIEMAARSGASNVELATVPMTASVTKQGLGIDDISHVMGRYVTKFAVTDRDRNFNLKLAASKINGTVLKPHEDWSFNGNVGERSEKEGYKVAHVIEAGEMVDGLAGGTCQISTTLFGAAFFAGLDIPKTTNHSRPSTYTPLGFDATVVWPDTDLVVRNPYDFPVVIHYRVANGEAVVEVLGKERPWTKVEFERKVVEESPYPTEERLDEEMPDGQTQLDQPGFNGYKLTRFRRFYDGKKMVKEQKWTVNYRPVTEFIRRGTSKDPNTKMPPEKEVHGPTPPKGEAFHLWQ